MEVTGNQRLRRHPRLEVRLRPRSSVWHLFQVSNNLPRARNRSHANDSLADHKCLAMNDSNHVGVREILQPMWLCRSPEDQVLTRLRNSGQISRGSCQPQGWPLRLRRFVCKGATGCVRSSLGDRLSCCPATYLYPGKYYQCHWRRGSHRGAVPHERCSFLGRRCGSHTTWSERVRAQRVNRTLDRASQEKQRDPRDNTRRHVFGSCHDS